MHRLRGPSFSIPIGRVAQINISPAVRAGVRDVEVDICLHAHALADFGGALHGLLVVGLGLVAGVDVVEGYAGGAVDDCEGHASGSVVGCPGRQASREVVVR